MKEILAKLSKSAFRSKFKLSPKDRKYIEDKGMNIIRRHAEDFIALRLAPAVIKNDGKQTPFRGHPVFVAQHATATCCRQCFYKWHGFPAGVDLSPEMQNYAVNLIMSFIENQIG